MRALAAPFEAIGAGVLLSLDVTGRYALFCAAVCAALVQPPWRLGLWLRQMEFVGVASLPIIVLTGFFSGAVMALQFGFYLHLFSADVYTGAIVGVVLTRELAPVFTALMVAGRCGSAMAAEIGTMRVTEQIDALLTLAVSPVHYLAVPRVVATVLMMPMLTMVYNVIGAAGAYAVAIHVNRIDSGQYLNRYGWFVDSQDLYMGLIKSVVFGFIVATIGCFTGYATRGGARGVGISTTTAVVAGSVVTLVADYFLTALLEPVLSTTPFSVIGDTVRRKATP